MIPGAARNWSAVNTIQQSTLNKRQKMTTLPLINSINRSFSRFAFILVPLVFACLVLPDTARAVIPPPDGGYPGETPQKDRALFSA
jgi:hypothetical protein